MDDLMGMMQELLSDPESMKQIQELAQMMQSDSDDQEEHSADAKPNEEGKRESEENESGIGFDFGMLMKLQQLMGTASDDKDAELLLALKPHLKEERQKKVDKAVKILKLLSIWSILRDSGMLNNLL